MDQNNPHIETKLLEQLSNGDEQAFQSFFTAYYDRLFQYIFGILKSRQVTEELVMDVFLKIWLKRSDLLDIQNFSAYLFTITRNHVYKSLKQIAKNYQIVHLSENNQTVAPDRVEDYLLDKEYTSLLHEAVTRLPKQQKEVYNLIKERGFKREEAASVLNLKPETIKFHLAEAMKNIRSFCTVHLDMIVFITLFIIYAS